MFVLALVRRAALIETPCAALHMGGCLLYAT